MYMPSEALVTAFREPSVSVGCSRYKERISGISSNAQWPPVSLHDDDAVCSSVGFDCRSYGFVMRHGNVFLEFLIMLLHYAKFISLSAKAVVIT